MTARNGPDEQCGAPAALTFPQRKTTG